MTTLRQGDRGPAVLELQWLLRATGHDPGPLDGVFGAKTFSAWVDAFSERWGDRANPDVIQEVDDEDCGWLRALPRRAIEMPRMLTPIAAVGMRIALCAGYAIAFIDEGKALGVNNLAVRVALAQLCVEHGCEPWGGPQTRALDRYKLLPPDWLRPKDNEAAYVAVWGNNIGNRQVGREHRDDRPGALTWPTVPYFLMSPVEGSGASAHPATSAHYSYPNAAEGAAAYWRFLRDHCGPALAAFEAGDSAAAAHEIKVGAWHYSGDEAAYARAMVDRFRSTAP